MEHSALEGFGEYTPLPQSPANRNAPARALPASDAPAYAPLFALGGILLAGLVFQSFVNVAPAQSRTTPVAPAFGRLEVPVISAARAVVAEPAAPIAAELPVASILPEPPVSDAPAATGDAMGDSVTDGVPMTPSIRNTPTFSIWRTAHNGSGTSGVATGCPRALKNLLASGMASYHASAAGYRTSGAHYASSGAGYMGSGAGYVSSGAGYASSGAGYRTSGAGYGSSGAGYRATGPVPSGAAPCNCGK